MPTRLKSTSEAEAAVDMRQLARIFLQMKAGDADPLRLAVHFDIDPAVLADRLVELRNLIGFRRIGVEIVFAVEFADIRDLAVERHRRFHRVFNRLTVQHRQHAGMAETDRTCMGIRRRAEEVEQPQKILDFV